MSTKRDTRIKHRRFNICLKETSRELKRIGLERLLSAVYGRGVTLVSLLESKGAPRDIIDALQLGNIGAVVEQVINHIRDLVVISEGGERRFLIVERYYGLDGNLPARLSAIGQKHGVSRERIRQLKDRGLSSLRLHDSLKSIESRLMTLVYRYSYPSFEPVPYEPLQRGVRLMTHDEHLRLDPDAIRLTQKQSDALTCLTNHRRVRVEGCAGSGKTLLAAHLALRLARRGEKTLFVCFSRYLANYLETLLAFQSNLSVSSFHALCLRHGTSAGLRIPGGWNSRVWSTKFPELLSRAVDRDESLKFDNVIVDDAHDFQDHWWTSIMDCLKSRSDGGLYYFLDNNVYLSTRAMSYPVTPATCLLDENIRTPSSVLPLVKPNYSSPNMMQSTNLSSALPDFYICENLEEVKQTLSHVYDDLMTRCSLAPSEIAVLTPKLPKSSRAFGARLRRSARLVVRDSRVTNHSSLCRIQTFRGLERKVILLVDLDERFASLEDSERRQMLYIALTRCTSKLIMIGDLFGWKSINSMDRLPQAFYSRNVVAESTNWSNS